MSDDAVHLGSDVGGTDPLVSPQQRRAFAQSTARLNIAHGPVRSGKTVALEILRWFEYVNTAPSGDLLMAGKTMKSLERNVLRPLKDWFGPLIEYSLGKKEADIAGRRVELEGANDERAEDKIRGMTLAGALCNEMTLMPESFFRQTLARMSVAGAKLFGSTNPDSPYHWLREDFLSREDELDLRQWRFRLEDNIFLDDSYVESLKAEYTGMWYQRFIEGLWVLAAGAVYSMFSESRHVQKCPIDLDEVETWRVPIDYGTSNPTTFALHGYWHGDSDKPHAHCFDEYYHSGRDGKQKTDEQYVQELLGFIPDQLKQEDFWVVVDPSAASFITACEAHGLRVKPAENAVLDGIRFVASMLGDDRYTINPSCEHTIREYQSYVWDEKAQQRGEDKPKKERDHCPDRDRYGLYTTLGIDDSLFTDDPVIR